MPNRAEPLESLIQPIFTALCKNCGHLLNSSFYLVHADGSPLWFHVHNRGYACDSPTYYEQNYADLKEKDEQP